MPKNLLEYADWLEERNLLWPAAPEPEPVKATPFLEPMPRIRAVTWNVYGTLLLIADGKLQPIVSDPMRMEVALEKTIHEFNMWNSMTRKAGAPWEYLLHQFKTLVEEQQLVGTGGAIHRGEVPEVDLGRIWRTLIERLLHKEYTWDSGQFGDLDEFSEKVAYFYQSCLQGVQAAPNAVKALLRVRKVGCLQGLIADGQCFTLVQLLRGLWAQGKTPTLSQLFTSGCVSLSYEIGARQPAPSLFEACLESFEEKGVNPGEVLHVGSRLREELAPAKKLGMHTALYAGHKGSLQASAAEVNDPALRPDRILTDLRQIRQIVTNDEAGD
jgi:hypothetical protein